MTPEQYAKLKRAFIDAEDLTSDERRAHIEHELADDSEALQHARAMLDAESRAGSATLTPNGGPGVDTPRPPAIAGYTIHRILGEGATGTVYEATQATPRRSVALKVLHRTDRGGRLARRFELEADFLARLRHPGIAQVYASGVADAHGAPRPWIAMELIEGEPITRWARRTDATRGQRLEVFLSVCEAVHYAHQRGVIHRDLKPANVLVDRDAKPKVLDFGIARAVEESTDADRLRTMQGEILGTLDYMSPEQARGETDAIDVRTDVYALGAILFELLEGGPPLDTRHMPLADALDAVRTAPRPRLAARGSGTDADLAVITSTALDLDPQRRYATADALVSDVRRVLNTQPILARAPSMSYQLLRFAQRRRAAVAAGGAVAVALVLATVVSLWFASRESAARVVADREREEAQQTLTLLTDALSAANPNIQADPDYTLRNFLADVAHSIADDPELSAPAEAQVRTAIGDALIGLGSAADALAQLDRAARLRTDTLGPGHERTIEVEVLRGIAMLDKGDTDRGRDHLQRTLNRARAALPADHTAIDDAMYFLASAVYKQGDVAGAEPLFRDLLERYRARFGEAHTETVAAMGSLGLILQRLERFDDAVALSERATELDIQINGPEHPLALSSRSNLALLYLRLGRLDEAEPILRDVLDARERVLPGTHRHIGVSRSLLARLHMLREEYDEAEPLAMSAYKQLVASLGPDHPYTRTARQQCATLYEEWGRPDEAARWRE